jgi:hypothetical protein
MKRYLLVLSILASLGLWAQKNISLEINHRLASQAFAMQSPATNDLGNNFDVRRLEYYVSKIELIHDGGTVTPVTDKYILVNASSGVLENLGSFNISNLEAIRFGIGVDPSRNNLDPSTYPANHPLAPKSPSMHWGWSAGYRFVAMEGKSGASLNQTYEFHALDNQNYFTQTIPTSGILNGTDIKISLNADYAEALNGIDVSSGVIIHGGSALARSLLQNFSTKVFKSSEGNGAVVGIPESSPSLDIRLSPNPVSNKEVVRIHNFPVDGSIRVLDITGKQVPLQISRNEIKVEFLPKGIYIVQVYTSNRILKNIKLIVS